MNKLTFKRVQLTNRIALIPKYLVTKKLRTALQKIDNYDEVILTIEEHSALLDMLEDRSVIYIG